MILNVIECTWLLQCVQAACTCQTNDIQFHISIRKYLLSDASKDTKRKITVASHKSLSQWHHEYIYCSVTKSGSLGLNIKLQLYTAVVLSTAIYASETWKSTRKTQNKLDVFHQRNLRKIIGVTWKDKVSNAEVLARTRQRRLQDIIGERRFRFAGHVQC